MSLDLEDLEQIANRYREQGYEVLLMPSAKQRPAFLADFQPDLIAEKGDDRVLVEVKYRHTTPSSRSLAELAATIAKQPGWRLDLVVFDSNGGSEVPETYESLDQQTLIRQLAESLELIDQGHEGAGAMLLWATFEGTLRAIAAKEAISVSPTATPSELIKAMIYEGILDEDDLASANAVLMQRNALVHGIRAAVSDKQTLSRIATLVQDLLCNQLTGAQN